MTPKWPDLIFIQLILSTKKQEIGTDCHGLVSVLHCSALSHFKSTEVWVMLKLGKLGFFWLQTICWYNTLAVLTTVFACSNIMSDKNGGVQTPLPPLSFVWPSAALKDARLLLKGTVSSRRTLSSAQLKQHTALSSCHQVGDTLPLFTFHSSRSLLSVLFVCLWVIKVVMDWWSS